ncbi:MAG: HK97 family phage prohead protease [Kiritimatiellae bacterium]|nr:HK97 family phage prohead protease [Kiritimatiellia bacterium]
MKIETRQNLHPVSVETREGKPAKIVGYAAVFYDGTERTQFQVYPGLVERIMPTAFDEALKSDDIRALFNHDRAAVLGRMAAGTLTLTTDKTGLRYEIDIPDTTLGRDLAVSLARGDITGSSFGFNIRGPDGQKVWETPDGKTYVRELVNVKLYDVGPVTFPAYEATSAGVRGLDECDADLRTAVAAVKARAASSVSALRRLRLALRERE